MRVSRDCYVIEFVTQPTNCAGANYTLNRIIPAKDYLKYFYSDRMHMYNRDTGKWNSPPPAYPPIMNGLTFVNNNENNNKHDENNGIDESDKRNKNISNLESYISMSEDCFVVQSEGNNEEKMKSAKQDGTNNLKQSVSSDVFGKVMTLAQLRTQFTKKCLEK